MITVASESAHLHLPCAAVRDNGDGTVSLYYHGDTVPSIEKAPVKIQPVLQHAMLRLSGHAALGWNAFDLLSARLRGGSHAAISDKLDYVVSCGANITRIMYPEYSAQRMLNTVYSGFPSDTVSDASFRPGFLAALDEVITSATARGIKLWITIAWYQNALPDIFAETLVEAYGSVSSATVKHLAAHAAWLADRYRSSGAVIAYGIGNEWLASDDDPDLPTVAQLADVYGYIASAIRAADSDAIVSAHVMGPTSGVSAVRESPSQYSDRVRRLSRDMDAWCVHLYPDNGFVGRTNSMGQIGAATGNTSGFESLESLLLMLRSGANSDGKLLVLGEYSVRHDEESDGSTAKRTLAVSVASHSTDLALAWNVQDAAAAVAGGQSNAYIDPTSVRGAQWRALLLRYQRPVTPSPIISACGPLAGFKTAASSSGSVAFVADASMAGHAGICMMMWVLFESTQAPYSVLANFVSDDGLSGAKLLIAPTPESSIYADFRGAGGSVGNSAGALPSLGPGTWHHVAIMAQQDAALGMIQDIYMDGILWRSKLGGGVVVSPAAGTRCAVGSTGGAVASFAEFAVMSIAGPSDVLLHMRGAVVPQSLVHMRAVGGTVIDVSRHGRPLDIGAGVATFRN